MLSFALLLAVASSPDAEVAGLFATACRRKDPRGCYGAGQVALRRGEPSRAERFFSKLCALAPRPATAPVSVSPLLATNCGHSQTIGAPACSCQRPQVAAPPGFPDECLPGIELGCSRGDQKACARVAQLARVPEATCVPVAQHLTHGPFAGLCPPGEVPGPRFHPAREALSSLAAALEACAPKGKVLRVTAVFDGPGGFVDLQAIGALPAAEVASIRTCVLGRTPPPGKSRWISWPPPQGDLLLNRLTLAPPRG